MPYQGVLYTRLGSEDTDLELGDKNVPFPKGSSGPWNPIEFGLGVSSVHCSMWRIF